MPPALIEGLAREGRVILGGDLAFTLSLRETSSDERAFLERHGRVSLAATMRAMARAQEGGAALVEVKAVDDAYPLYGTVGLEPAQSLADILAERDGAFGAAADPALLARLGLRLGAHISLGAATIEIRAALLSQSPTSSPAELASGPRLLISERALRASGLVQPGSMVRWHYRLRLPDILMQPIRPCARLRPLRKRSCRKRAGTFVRAPMLRLARPRTSSGSRNISPWSDSTALLVGGVGVANAVKGQLDGRREVIATMKSLGATGSRVFAIYLSQVLVLAGIGAIPGLVIGAALAVRRRLEPRRRAAVAARAGAASGRSRAGAPLSGLLTAAAFALWPLGRAHDVPVSALFRDEVAERSALAAAARYVVGDDC